MKLKTWGRVLVAIFTPLLVVALSGCASSGPSGAAEIHGIKKVVDLATSKDSSVTSTEFVQVFQDSLEIRVQRAASRQMVLVEGDSLSVESMWRVRLRLATSPGEWGWVVLTPELMTAQGDPVPGPEGGGAAGLYSIRRRQDRAVLDVHRGGVVLKDWGANTSEAICVRAAGRCAVATDGASFLVHVDAEGAANLYVESGAVTVTSESPFLECRAANAPPDVACDIATPMTAAPDTLPLLGWSVDRSPTAGKPDPRWPEVMELWRERVVPGWAPWLLVPAAIVGCIATDFWICGGDDSISGTVIVVGS